MTHEKTITLPDSFEIESRGQAVTIDLTKLPPELLAYAVVHGLRQRISDAASGAAYAAAEGALGKERAKQKANVRAWTSDPDNAAEIASVAREMMKAARDTLESGQWGKVRSGQPGVSAEHVRARQLAANAIKLALRAVNRVKDYTGLTTAEKHARCDAYIEKHPELLEQARAELQAEREIAAQVDLADLGF